jgi:hypothetical protein
MNNKLPKSNEPKKLKKRTTNIIEEARRELGITRDQYAFCAYVAYRCADPRNKQAGWCTDRIEDIAEFVGISRQGLYKMANAMNEFGLINIDNHWHFRPTAKWIDVESGCKQSLQNGDAKIVNKVDKGRKQSLQELREIRKQSLQTPIYSKIKKSKNEGEGENTPTLEEKFNALIDEKTRDVEEKKEKAPSIPGGFPGGGLRVEIYEPPVIDFIPGTTGKSKATTEKEARELIEKWCGENSEHIRWSYDAARRKLTPEDLRQRVIDYCGHFATTENLSKQFLFFNDPARLFQNGLTKWLQRQNQFDREPVKNLPGQPETKYTPPVKPDKIPAYTP